MKLKSLFNKAQGLGLFNLLLVLFAAALGADSAFAMAEVVVKTDPTEKVADSKGLETQIPGEGASMSEATESGFTAEEIDSAIAEFQAYQTPVEASVAHLAEKVDVDSYEVIHYRSATPVFVIGLQNSSPITTSDTGADQEIELTIGTDIDRKSARLLYECKNVYVKEAKGYLEDGTADGMLALYVTKNDRTSKVTFRILNPDARPSGANVATIPAKAHLIIGAVAASESQREVAPDNFEPVPTTVYLQQRIFNIVMTLDWINGKKKVKFAEEDMRKGALYAYKVSNEITDLIGVQSRFKVEAGRQMTDEYTYTAKGILRQVNMYYSYEDDNLLPTDLTAIAKMQFTKFSANRTAQVFCGQDFIAALLNMDTTTHKEISFKDVEYAGLSIKGWKNNFGQLDFIYTPVFDLLGFEKCALAVDVKNARNYTKKGPKFETVDMRQGAAETRNAKRDIYSQTYAVALRGYNAMFIGPASEMASVGMTFSNFTTTVNTVAALPTTNLATGVVYYLSADNGGFKKGSFVERNETNTSWKLYNGELQRV